jgi:hypothetical protein
LKMSGVGFAAITMLPRVAFAARNSVLSMRTGIQPNGKTRLVIETSARPSYDISYPQISWLCRWQIQMHVRCHQNCRGMR